MRLVSWNVAGRRSVEAQVEALATRQPDMVALQEVTPSSVARLRRLLPEIGLTSIRDTAADIDPGASRNRQLGVLIAANTALADPLHVIRAPWAEKSCSVGLAWNDLVVDLHAVHIPPGSSHGALKLDTFEAVYRALATPSSRPRILCGDFNAPQAELPDGTVVTWGQCVTKSGAVRRRNRRGQGDRWDRAERSVLCGLAAFDLADVYRALHGPRVTVGSFWLRRGRKTFERRFDHVFASESLAAKDARYHPEVVDAGLSDHALLEVEFSLPGSPGFRRAGAILSM